MISDFKHNKLIFLSSLLFLSIPLMLITGPFIPDLFLVIISLIFIFSSLENRNYLFFKNKLFLYFILFCIIASIISISSTNFSSMKSSFLYFRFGLFVIAAYSIVTLNKKILKYLLYLFLIIYSILFIDTLYQYFFSKNIIGLEYVNKQNFRITSFFGKDEVLGSYTSRFFPLFLFLIIFNSDFFSYKNKSTTILFITVMSFIIVLFSGERTSIALFVLSFFFIFLSSKKIRKILIVPLFLVIIISTISLSSIEKIRDRVLTQTINQLGLNSESERLVLFSKTYEGHYLIALNMFKDKPFLGHGPKMFRFYCSKTENFVANNACSTHPHNFYAQMLSELGLFGFFLMISIFFVICILFIKNLYFQLVRKRQFLSDYSICLLAGYFITFFPLLPSGNFFNNWLSIIIYYPLGFLFYLIKEKKFYA